MPSGAGPTLSRCCVETNAVFQVLTARLSSSLTRMGLCWTPSAAVSNRLTRFFVDHQGAFFTEAPRLPEKDGAQFVVRYLPEGEEFSENWSHEITYGGKSHCFAWTEEKQGGAPSLDWASKGLCRIAIRDGKFAVLFPTLQEPAAKRRDVGPEILCSTSARPPDQTQRPLRARIPATTGPRPPSTPVGRRRADGTHTTAVRRPEDSSHPPPERSTGPPSRPARRRASRPCPPAPRPPRETADPVRKKATRGLFSFVGRTVANVSGASPADTSYTGVGSASRASARSSL